jgi:hypothetical protein
MDLEAFIAIANGNSLVKWGIKRHFFQCQFCKKETRNFVPITLEELENIKVSCTILK